MPDTLSEQVKTVYRVIRDHASKTSSLHPRRSLDQFFYSGLPETSSRDMDQVVYKNTKASRGGEKMVMVDQLWLWFLEVRGPTDEAATDAAILTCFPQKDEEGKPGEEDLQEIADLRRAIIDEANSKQADWMAEGSNLVGLILDQAVNVMLGVRNEQSLDFLDVFRAAIAEAVRIALFQPVRDREVSSMVLDDGDANGVLPSVFLFSHFPEQTDKQTTYFREFQLKLEKGSDDISDPKTKRDEVKLALEIADIIDELNSINRLFESQKDTLETVVKLLRPYSRYDTLRDTVIRLINQDIESYSKQVRRMMGDARRTKEGVSTGFLPLLFFFYFYFFPSSFPRIAFGSLLRSQGRGLNAC